MKRRVYVVISPVWNEERDIEKTIRSVLTQTILPLKWVVVNDSSTDRTEEIVRSYSLHHKFIQLITTPKNSKYGYASKALATHRGYDQLRNMTFDFVGILDGDHSFAPDYYERVMSKFDTMPRLGIAGGVILHNVGGHYRQLTHRLNHVGGGIQLFRRECYEQVGGLRAISTGGTDIVAEVSARQLGWETRVFPELQVLHHRQVGTRGKKILKALFLQGALEYGIGSHPFFVAAKCVRRIGEKPYAVGSLMRMLGYCYYHYKRESRQVSDDFINILRSEQMRRLRSIVSLKGASPLYL